MTSILDQLNFIRHSKEDFLKIRKSYTPTLSDDLDNILKLIKNNIKKSGGSNSPFQNQSFNKNNHYSKNNYKSNESPSKSWRLTKTKLVADNLTVFEKNRNEINSLLNKLSPKNFNNIIDKIVKYYNDNSTKDLLIESTINNIFLKAVMQPVYCPWYVKFLKILDEKYEKIDLINAKCIEFKNIIQPKIEAVSKDMSMSEQEKYDLFCKAIKEKKYKEGYSQFIGELFNNNMINNLTLDKNISYFVENLETSSEEDASSSYVEDLLICICKLFDTVCDNKNSSVIITYFDRVLLIKNNSKLPKRLKFKLMDLHDLMKKKSIIV